jgi:endonuclease/exonuclease/phosphatase family metal-dependent hydrolase
MTTTIKFMTDNGRKDNIPEKYHDRHWDGPRMPAMMQFLKAVNPTVMAGQEWTVNMCNDLMEHFPNWTYMGGVKFGNCPVVWNTTIMRAEEGTEVEWHIPSDKVERYMTLVRLTHIETGWGAWFGAMHLAAGDPVVERDEVHLRATQMKTFIGLTKAWIAAHPYPEDEKPNLIVGGDLNDYQANGGVRKIAYDLAGWKQIRMGNGHAPGRLPLTKITGEGTDSFNGWHTHTLRQGRWIDEIFTSGVELQDASIQLTDKTNLPVHASDHNGLLARVVVTAPPSRMV